MIKFLACGVVLLDLSKSLRVNHVGNISNHLHSSEWGTHKQQPYIQTDFAESQLELITPPTVSISKLQDWLSSFHQIVATTNEKDGGIYYGRLVHGHYPREI